MTIIGNIFKTEYTPEFHFGNRSYAGKILHVDLSTGEMNVEEPPEAFYRRYIGSLGFILHYLLNETKPNVVWLSTGRIHAHL
ncbi:MAG: aldehyde ferredoxin oxidoreductase N-terminal domain-containing protein [Anaerolineaceae bacterium]|nr:aldehyde ferredoxin oxidoreductase N-terminal domain-containing protein [Anaerolineaceae bacterium]